MTSFLRFFPLHVWCVIAALTAAICFPELAQAQGGPTGGISGRVYNSATGSFLEGAEVSLNGAAAKVTTDREGRFSLGQLTAGTYQLNVRYTGLSVFTREVALAAGGNEVIDVALSNDVYELGAFAVTGQREGNAAALTKQQVANNVVNVVATDAYGNVADGNLGSFLQNLPGIAPTYFGSDIVGISLRGAPPDLTAVTVNGVRTASATAGFTPNGDRAALIDQIPAEFIKEVEVIKATTPEQPSDGLGGQVNLITKSPYDFRSRVISYRGGLSLNTYRDDPTYTLNRMARYSTSDPRTFMGKNFGFTYLDTFGTDRKFGVSLSASYTNTNNAADEVWGQFNEVDSRDTRARQLASTFNRVVYGLESKIEFRPDPSTRLWFEGSERRYTLDINRVDLNVGVTANRVVADYAVVSRAAIEAGATPRNTAGAAAGVAPGYTDSFTELLNATYTDVPASENKRNRQYKAEAGFEKKWQDSKLMVSGSYNPAQSGNNFHGFTTTLTGVGFSIDRTQNRSLPIFRQTYGPAVAAGSDLSRYTAQYFQQPDTTKDRVVSARADYDYSLSPFNVPVTLKAGLDYRAQHYWYITYRPTWNYVGPDGVVGLNPATGVNDDNLARFRNASPGYGAFNNLYARRDDFYLPAIESTFANSPSYFVPVGTSVSFHAPPSSADERVSSAYIQGTAKVGKVTLLGGVRGENTDVKTEGSFSDPANPAKGTTKLDGDYRKYFPSLHLRYEPIERVLLRASYSTSSARPAISALVPNTTVSLNSANGLGSVTQGNPNLKPYYSRNYDLSAEYYFEPSGVISIGAYQKDISDFIGSFSTEIPSGPNNGFGGAYAGYFLNTNQNLYAAKIKGVELNYQQQFVHLPQPFNGLSIFANYTYLKSSGRYAAGASELVGFVPRTYNGGFLFSWRKLGTRITYHYKGDYLEGYNAIPSLTARVDRYTSLDMNVSYNWRPWLTTFIDATNVTNTTTTRFVGDRSRVVRNGATGPTVNVGVSGRF